MKRNLTILVLLAASSGLFLNAEAAKGGGFGGGGGGSFQQPQQNYSPSTPSVQTSINDPSANLKNAAPPYSVTKAGKPDPNMPSDDVLKKYLNSSQLSQWSDALKKIQEGDDEVASGQIMAKQMPASTTDDMTAIHQQGKDSIKEGEAKVDGALATLAGLRKLAKAAMDNNPDNMPGSGSFTVRVSAAMWPTAIKGMTDAMLNALWASNYKKIYLADVYSFEDSHYVAKPDASDALSKVIAQSDAGHGTFVAKHDWKFALKKEGSGLVIDFPDRGGLQTDGTKAALVVGELLYDHDSGYATFSLRAVDVSNWRIAYSKLSEFAVEPKLGKMIGLADYQVPSGHSLPGGSTTAKTTTSAAPAVAAKDAPAMPSALKASLDDAGSLINTFKSSGKSYTFRALTSGKDNTPDNRYALLLLKSILADSSGLNITDYDFLSTVLPGADADRSIPLPDVNVAWVVPDVKDYTDNSIELDLKAKNLASGSMIDAGKLNIDRSLSALTRPTAAELKDGGYTPSATTTAANTH